VVFLLLPEKYWDVALNDATAASFHIRSILLLSNFQTIPDYTGFFFQQYLEVNGQLHALDALTPEKEHLILTR
jgi:hypothetical protein